MIQEISYQECLVLWERLWATRNSPITETSAMTLQDTEMRGYSSDIGQPVFLGAFVDGILVGVNSLHSIDDTVRSRGLFVVPEHRKNGIGEKLLRETVNRARGSVCWSFPKKEAIGVYLSSGFRPHSQFFHDPVEMKWNCYVSSFSG